MILSECVRHVAARAPDSPSIEVWGDDGPVEMLTYLELDELSDGVAARWRRGSAAPDVAILEGDTSKEAIVAALGAMKAGSAYAPVGPDWPTARRDGVAALLPDATRLDSSGSRQEDPEDSVEVEAAGSSPLRAPPGPVAQSGYVMFTSGTTGVPKGVQVSGRSLQDLLEDPLWDQVPVRRVPTWSPFQFDASLFEVWVPLSRGGTVLIPPMPLSLRTIRLMCEQGRASSVHLTAGLLRLVGEEEPDLLAGPECLLTGGDVVPRRALDAVMAAAPGLRVLAMYGPTEATLFASCYEVPAEASMRPRHVPLGSPLSTVEMKVLDDWLEDVPAGEVGEVYISGPCLADGYVGQPALTADRFVADPGADGARMYRSGDLARVGRDNSVTFVGRSDDQVKIRGYRVEPGEVEQALEQIDGVGAAVVATAGTGATKVLVAHVLTATRTATLSAEVIREDLATVLPDHLVPTRILIHQSLPLNANGKVDRKAVLAIDEGSGEASCTNQRSGEYSRTSSA